MKTHTVEVLITVAQDGSKVYDGEPKFKGEYVLRAFATDGALLHEVTGVVADLSVTTSDYARLVTLQAALERLHAKLCGQKAWYALRVAQSSKNVGGWLGKGWKRNAAEVKALAGATDVLLKPFPHIEWVQLPRTELDARMKSGRGVMLTV